MTTDAQVSDYSHDAWLVLMHRDPMAAAMAAHLLRKERDEAVQSLADVRTLDSWVEEGQPRWYQVDRLDGSWICNLFESAGGDDKNCGHGKASTPDEARSEAAAWVRGLK